MISSDIGYGSRLCEKSARYICTLNFEGCGHAESKKALKFVLRTATKSDRVFAQPGPAADVANLRAVSLRARFLRQFGSFSKPVVIGGYPQHYRSSFNILHVICKASQFLPSHAPIAAFMPKR